MKKLSLAALAAVTATPALAHHPLGGAPMETFAHGVMSGVGHPVLGIDHLFFVFAVGIAAALAGRLISAPLAYLGAMAAGVALVVNGVALPAAEFVIAASLIVLGGWIATGRSLAAPAVMALFAAAGLFHGWAFGGMIAGQEGGLASSVIAGYLIGLVAAQWLIAVAAGWLAGRAAEGSMVPRLAGATVAGVGITFFLEGAESAALAAMGLG